jgi:hypothetical protein
MNRSIVFHGIFLVFVIFISALSTQKVAQAIGSKTSLADWPDNALGELPAGWDFFETDNQYARNILLICDDSLFKTKSNKNCEEFWGGSNLISQINKDLKSKGVSVSLNPIIFKTQETYKSISTQKSFVCGKKVVKLSIPGEGETRFNFKEIIETIRKSIQTYAKKNGFFQSPDAISGIGPEHSGKPIGLDLDWAFTAINAPFVQTDASQVRVAILDTGLKYINSQLTSGITPLSFLNGNLETPSSKADDAYLGINGPPSVSKQKTQGHGTLIASIIKDTYMQKQPGSIKINSGVTHNVEILPIQVCDNNGICPLDSIIAGICAASAPDPSGKPQPISQVLNLSLGTYLNTPILEGAIQDAISAGALVVAGAGNSRGFSLPRPVISSGAAIANLEKDGLIAKNNSGNYEVQPPAFCNAEHLSRVWNLPSWKSLTEIQKDTFFASNPGKKEQGRHNCKVYPAALSEGVGKPDGLISVGSVSPIFTSPATLEYRYSNFSTKNENIDLVAPGEQILARQSNGKTTTVDFKGTNTPAKIYFQQPAIGTSYSAAYVSGAAAAIIAERAARISTDPSLKPFTPIELEKILIESIKNIKPSKCFPGPGDPLDVCGAGLLDIKAALALAATK